MPNGRRTHDYVKEFSDMIIKALKGSDWEVKEVLGATTCWEGEQRIVVTKKILREVEHKGIRPGTATVFIWFDEYNPWKANEHMRKQIDGINKILVGKFGRDAKGGSNGT
jgi:hypothetical protein